MAASVYESEMSRALDTRLVPSSPQVPDSVTVLKFMPSFSTDFPRADKD